MAVNSKPSPRRRGRTTGAILLEFLGSMNLAITLLVAVSIASVVGTVLQQNQDYADYLIKFGPFWFEMFRRLGLYDVYSASWFLFILAFLVVSVSVCIYRHTPAIWRDVTRYRDHLQATSLRVMRNHRSWRLDADPETAREIARRLLTARGYRVRERAGDERTVIAAMKGRLNRFGYVFTHAAVVVICVGALLDGNLPLKLREYFGELAVETRNIPLSEIPPESRLPVGTGSFRGQVSIPEGQQAGVLFLPLRDGYVVQDLPFDIRVEDFRIEHYPSGQPKSFESDLVILDPDLDAPLRETISVNDPLTYKGHTIYQASFSDGGSALDLRVWPLAGPVGETFTLDSRVFENESLTIAGRQRTLELDDFSLFNVRPNPQGVETPNDRFRNVGPSFTYKLRTPAGEAREYNNYMVPVEIDGNWYFLSGVRSSPAEEFRYLHIPADGEMSPRRFMGFLERLRDPAAAESAALAAAGDILGDLGLDDDRLAPRVATSAERMLQRLADGGFPGVERFLQARFEGAEDGSERRETLLEFSRMVLDRTLERLYRRTLAEERGVRPEAVTLDEADRRFYRDALDAVSGLAQYGAPVWLQLTGFEHIQATGLQIARAPGKNVVYFGFALIIVGVFLQFYVAHRRVWAVVIPHRDYTELLLAGVSHRHASAFREEFDDLTRTVDRALDRTDSRTTTGDR